VRACVRSVPVTLFAKLYPSWGRLEDMGHNPLRTGALRQSNGGLRFRWRISEKGRFLVFCGVSGSQDYPKAAP
jgi:hypothetical protein